jgi:hypothetical protein
MGKGIKKLKYYNPFDIKENDNVVFFFDRQGFYGKVLQIDYPLVLINSQYNLFLVYIGQIKRKDLA